MTLEQYLDELTNALKSAFGSTLTGVLLSGSTSIGAHRQGASDVDVLVAVEQPDRASLDRVVASCSHDVLPCPATKLELAVYDVAVLADPGPRPRWGLNFDTGEGVHHVGLDASREPSHWFVLDLAFARRHAVPLFGSATIGDPGDDVVAHAFDEMVEWYEQHEPAHADVARMRADHWRRTRTFMPKPGLPST
jgi:hypothetical protein